MPPIRKLALVSAGALAAVGLAGAALAAINHSHVLTLRLPDGSREQIFYIGDTPPTVRMQPGPASLAAFPAPMDPLRADAEFAALQRMSAQMDREAAALLQQQPLGPAGPMFAGPMLGGPGSSLMTVDLGKLPPGVHGYSMVSTITGGKVCTRTTEYGAADGSGAPREVTRVSGDCGASAVAPSRGAAPAASARDPAARSPLLQSVSYRR
jgi:hypothetical protein